MKKTIELTWEQIDAIVVAELQEAYRLNVTPTRDEAGLDIDPDGELAKALEVVLQYFMSHQDYQEWIQQYESSN